MEAVENEVLKGRIHIEKNKHLTLADVMARKKNEVDLEKRLLHAAVKKQPREQMHQYN